MDAVGRYRFRLRTTDVDAGGGATLPALAGLLQEAAWMHAAHLGASTRRLLEDDLTWVLNRMRIVLDTLPRHHDDVVVETWPSGAERLFLHRDFSVLTPEGEELARATTRWVVFDAVARKAARVPDWITDIPVTDRGRLGYETKKPVTPGSCRHVTTVEARWYDLDLNEHANNVRLVEWLVEALPAAHLRAHVPADLDVTFKSEVGLGTRLRTEAEPDGPAAYLHKLTDDDRIVAVARTSWRQGSPRASPGR